MNFSNGNQKGFLAVIAVLLVVVVSLICAAASYQFVDDTQETTNSFYSAQAFYVALAAVEVAKHNLRSGTTCSSSNNFETTIQNIPGNPVSNNVPGLLYGTYSYNSGTSQCTITATGDESPTFSTSNINATRVVQALDNSSGISFAPLIAINTLTLGSTGGGTGAVTNFAVNVNSAAYLQSTMVTAGGNLNIVGTASYTAVTGLNPSSSADVRLYDLGPNFTGPNSPLTTSNLFSQFFTKTESQITSAATTVTAGSQLSGVSGGTYYYNGNLSLTNYTIGTSANPTILIVNGNLTLTGVTYYGFIYVVGSGNTSQILSGTTINGSMAAEGSITYTGSGNVTVAFNTTVLNKENSLNTNTVLHFYDSLSGLTEVTP